MDLIKDAFQKVKEDIFSLKAEIIDVKKELGEIQFSILALLKSIDDKKENKITSTDRHETSTLRQINSTDNLSSTNTSTDILPFQALKELNLDSSIGNDGVSTDRQTDRQTVLPIKNQFSKLKIT